MSYLGFGIPGGQEGLLVLLAILLLFGATRVPALARALGRSLGEFKKGKSEGGQDDTVAELPENDSSAEDKS